MTGALTRRRFYLDAEKYRTTLTAVISLDLNDLKALNDQYGHIEGDRALITITNVVKVCTSKSASLYRIGGDEFMLLCYKMSEDRVQEPEQQEPEQSESKESEEAKPRIVV